ncbi:hypothetical protein BJ508DRAFT_310690 [Ascobolus immersus RN42]|uniref:Uncharacterized protein n=1 Tax=Ascobolus immersus RN42 TaxID=1160509 RepID=A0A3N4HY16_ASCIM|nr:hypothetical protein BJ508DRAFT_310690 [Ascobolus immersus RN42]
MSDMAANKDVESPAAAPAPELETSEETITRLMAECERLDEKLLEKDAELLEKDAELLKVNAELKKADAKLEEQLKEVDPQLLEEELKKADSQLLGSQEVVKFLSGYKHLRR